MARGPASLLSLMIRANQLAMTFLLFFMIRINQLVTAFLLFLMVRGTASLLSLMIRVKKMVRLWSQTLGTSSLTPRAYSLRGASSLIPQASS